MPKRLTDEERKIIMDKYLSFPAGLQRKRNRDKLIVDLVNQDYTFQEIGELFNISKQRVHQIYWKQIEEFVW